MHAPIYETIMNYSRQAGYPWHMPGHKRRLEDAEDVFAQMHQYDFTEIPGLDEYHSPEGVIRQAQVQAAQAYGVENSYFLVNGSTVGILASLSAACARGSHILVGRNCHRSVYHGIELLQLQATYVMPAWLSEWDFYGSVSVEAVRRELQRHPDISCVVLTSPTYEGVVSDIAQIADVVHEHGAVLIVDEAHGAHLKWMTGFPVSAVDCGADLVIQSLHKTLPALTQTAVLHRCTERVREDKLFHYVSLYQSTSPSYLLMASMDYAIQYMAEHVRERSAYVDRLGRLREALGSLSHIRLFQRADGGCARCYDYDDSKLVLSVKKCGMCGETLAGMLAQHGQVVEMAGSDYVICMTSVMDSEEAFAGLYQVLCRLDAEIARLEEKNGISKKDLTGVCDERQKNMDEISFGITDFAKKADNWNREQMKFAPPRAVLRIADALERVGIWQEMSACLACVSAGYVYAYPPGSPLLVPGELITRDVLQQLEQCITAHLNMKGIQEGKLFVLAKDKESI